jgi:CHAT domain-containing protein
MGIKRRVLFGFLWLTAVLIQPALGSALEEGKAAAIGGDYPAAIRHWSRLLAQPDAPQRLEALIRRGEAYRALGHYRSAEADFKAAQTEARETGHALWEAMATQLLGQVHLLQHEFTAAEEQLRASLAQALRLQQPALAAASANSLGSVLFHQRRNDEAKARYGQALTLAQQAEDPGLVVAARRNRASLLHGEHALAELRAAQEAAAAVASPHERTELLLGIAIEATGDAVLRYQSLKQALNTAKSLDAPRLQSLAAGHLAAFYEEQGHIAKAHTLTEQAIQAAQRAAAPELLLRWEGQRGRLMQRQGNPTAAIEAYQRAIYYFQSIRQDLSLTYPEGHFSLLRESLEPLYHNLVDLLLQQAATETEAKEEQRLLREARDTLERIKLSELQDYFRDPCVVALTEEIKVLSPTTAVLYPVILQDRLELLVSIDRRLYRRTRRVGSNELEAMARTLSDQLRPGGRSSESERPARKGYKWLIQPILPLLEKHAVDTLVFVPDGPLRLMPIAALKDGQQYLVERYAIVTTPGLTLLDPRPLPRQQMQSLLAGLSRPSLEVVGKLPNAMLDSLALAPPQSAEHRQRGIPVTVTELQTLPPPELRKREVHTTAIAERLKLPGVNQEIAKLSQQLTGKVLLDEAFQLKHFVSEIQRELYQVVHIASHGFFGSTAEESFIMTYDELLTLNALAELLQPKQLAERPVELLVLSACQTAEGNDRTPLGLSGVALKSGARSALGSLWPVHDEATQKLLLAFYTYLSNPGVTKTQALQQAQLELLRSDEFAHPYYWAAFILVGNWL